MKNLITHAILLSLSSFLVSCTNISCGIEAGLASSVGCGGGLSSLDEGVTNAMAKNYQMFHYAKHGDIIDKAKSCATNFIKKDDIRECSSIIDTLDSYCFDDKDFVSCQYLYEIQNKLYTNHSYSTKIVSFTKNHKLPLSKNYYYFFPTKSKGNYAKCKAPEMKKGDLNDIYAYMNSKEQHEYMNCVGEQTLLNHSNVPVLSRYEFTILDSNIDGEISWSELTSFVKKVEGIINRHNGTGGGAHEELSKLHINEDLIKVSGEIFAVCNQKKSPMSYNALNACNMSTKDKQLIHDFNVFDDNNIHVSEVLSMAYTKLYKYSPTYNQYKNFLLKQLEQ